MVVSLSSIQGGLMRMALTLVFCMTVLLNLLASLGAGRLQPGVGFGSSYSHSRLDAPGVMADLALRNQRNQREQPAAVVGRRQASRLSVTEALELARPVVGATAGFHADQARGSFTKKAAL